MSATPIFIDDHHLRIGTTDFYCDHPLSEVPDGLLPVMKRRGLVERYIALLGELQPAVIVELGIHRGGSTALLSELTSPEKLIALEIHTSGPPALSAYLDGRDLGDVVRPHYGVDQADRVRVTKILADELGSRPIDLVIDDASHLFAPTRPSFESVFPRLRPGGLFVLEDWNADHLLANRITQAYDDVDDPWHEAAREGKDAAKGAGGDTREVPFLQLVVEFLLARASSGDAIREITIDEDWVVVRRGADPLDPYDFRLSDLVNDHFGFTAPAS